MNKKRMFIPLHKLYNNPKNPRKHLHIEDLTDSIVESGQLVPLLVRPFKDGYQIISGHRRKAALERAMVSSDAECDVVEMDDEQTYKALMVTNIQAQTLSEIEEAEGIKHMMELCAWTQDKVAKEFGKKQNWVSYRLSLLNLDETVKEHIITRVITPTHAREIAQLPQVKQAEVAQKVVDEKLSTRETADLVKTITQKEVVLVDRSTGEILEEETTRQIDDQLKQREAKEYKVIEDVHDFILAIKDFHLDIQPLPNVIEAIVELGRSTETIGYINQVESKLKWLRTQITNVRDRPDGSTAQDNVIEFRKAE